MKKIYCISLISLSLFLVTGCKGGVTTNTTYKQDLKNLVDGPWKKKSEITNYDISCTEKVTNSNRYIYTVKITYSNMELRNFRAILLPEENLVNYTSSNLPHVGYTNKMNLVATRINEDKYNYPQYKLQIEKVVKQESIYVSVCYGNTQDLIKF